MLSSLPFQAGVALTLVSLVALLVAERRESRLGIWVAKPLASTGFLVAAWGAGATSTPWGTAVLVGLVLGWWGDVLLIPHRTFLLGLVAFLLGHLGFAVAFALRGLAPVGVVVPLVVLGPGVFAVWRWLGPHLPPKMRIPVVAYIAVITAMVALAAGTFGHRANLLLLVGAVLFFLSDLSVARHRFVERSFTNKLWGLPFYYGGQLLIAASVGWDGAGTR